MKPDITLEMVREWERLCNPIRVTQGSTDDHLRKLAVKALITERRVVLDLASAVVRYYGEHDSIPMRVFAAWVIANTDKEGNP